MEKFEGAPGDLPADEPMTEPLTEPTTDSSVEPSSGEAAPLDETAPTDSTEGAATLDPSTSELPPPPSSELSEPLPLDQPAEANSDFESEELAPVEVPETPATSAKPKPSPSPSASADGEDLPL